jgi:hypothetical protein
MIELDEGPAESARGDAPERRLAGAAQADQRDAADRGRCLSGWRIRRFSAQRRNSGLDRIGLGSLQQFAQQGPLTGQGLVAYQVFDRCAGRARHASQQDDRKIALAAFKLGEIALGDARSDGQRLARHAAKRAHLAHPLAKLAEEGAIRRGAGGRVGLRSGISALLHSG